MQDTPSDDELLGLMQAGDETAFVALYRRRQGQIFRFALRMSGSEAIAEDVTQEVFLSLIRGNGNFNLNRGALRSYLYGIARNQVLRRIEKDRSHLPVEDDDGDRGTRTSDGLISSTDPLGDLTRRETVESVRQAVLSLPAHYREVVVLCDLHEMSYLETSEILGCAVGTVRSRLHRARAMLVEKLSGEAEKGSTQPRIAGCYL